MRMLVATGVMGFTPTPDVSLQRSGETARAWVEKNRRFVVDVWIIC